MVDGARGQVFLADFLFSAVFFVASAAILFSAWASLQSSFEDSRGRAAAAAFSHSLAESLVSGEGFPEEWDSETVSSIGLASERFVLDSRKLLELRELGEGELRALLGTGGYGVNLSVERGGSADYSGVLREPVAYYSCSENSAGPLLEGSEFDYYWCGEGSEEHFGERAFYSGGKVGALNALLANESEYASILIEAPELSEAQAASVNLSALQSFLSESGTLVYAGDGGSEAMLLADGFGAEFGESAGTGTVSETEYFLYNVSAGAEVSTDSSWAVNASGEEFVSSDSGALFASWAYGSGTIYFAPDLEADFGGVPALQVLNLRGWPLSFGGSAGGPAHSAVVSVPCLVQGDLKRPAVLKLVLWSDSV